MHVIRCIRLPQTAAPRRFPWVLQHLRYKCRLYSAASITPPGARLARESRCFGGTTKKNVRLEFRVCLLLFASCTSLNLWEGASVRARSRECSYFRVNHHRGRGSLSSAGAPVPFFEPRHPRELRTGFASQNDECWWRAGLVGGARIIITSRMTQWLSRGSDQHRLSGPFGKGN